MKRLSAVQDERLMNFIWSLIVENNPELEDNESIFEDIEENFLPEMMEEIYAHLE